MTVRFGAVLIPGTELFITPQLAPTVCSLGFLGSAGRRHPDRDRRSANVLRRRRRIIYDARESSSPVSDSEAIEKYEENRPGARERNLTLTSSARDSAS